VFRGSIRENIGKAVSLKSRRAVEYSIFCSENGEWGQINNFTDGRKNYGYTSSPPVEREGEHEAFRKKERECLELLWETLQVEGKLS